MYNIQSRKKCLQMAELCNYWDCPLFGQKCPKLCTFTNKQINKKFQEEKKHD